jgi:hypothetical protein
MQLGYSAQSIPEDEVVVDGQEVTAKILSANVAQRYDDRRIQSFSYDGKAFSVLLLELGTHTNNLIATDKVYQEIENSLVS